MKRQALVAYIANEIESDSYGNDAYDVVAFKVADKIRHVGRLINVDEIAEIAAGVVARNEVASSEMTKAGYDALDKTSKVNVDGVPHVIVGGEAVKVSFVNDPMPKTIANSIYNRMRMAYNGAEKSGQLFDELFVAEGDECCPECGSCDCTMFFGEDDGDAWHCNTCDADFFVETMGDVETYDEIELVPEQDIVLAFERDDALKSFNFTLFRGDEPIYDGAAGNYDSMQAFASGFINAYDTMRPGIGIANVTSGKRFDVDFMSGDCVTCKGMTASRSKMAAAIADGTMMVVSDQIYANDVVAGDTWASMTHDVEVDIVDGDSVYWYENEREGKAISANDYYTDSIQGFLAHMDVDGFSQV